MVLTDIYQEEINVSVWQRNLDKVLKQDVDTLLLAKPHFVTSMTTSPDRARANIIDVTDDVVSSRFADDVAELVEMFCCLFDLRRVGLRLATLDRAMCPRFHVDRVPCRLVTTYQGIATEWLPHQAVNRAKLGHGSNGEPDSRSGLYNSDNDIRRLSRGDVALFKGELWPGNEGAGLVHRSPQVPCGENRLLLTLDFSD